MRRLDRKELTEKLRELLLSPWKNVDLPRYVVAAWTVDHHNTGKVFNTAKIDDVAQLHTLLNHPSAKDIILYEFDPVDYVFRNEMGGWDAVQER